MYYKERSKSIPSVWHICDGSVKTPNGDAIIAWTHHEEVANRIVQGMGMVSAIHKRDINYDKESTNVASEHHTS